MVKLLDKIKFEHVFIILLIVIQGIVMFKFADSPEVVDKLVTALIATITAVTAYIFTKYKSE